MQITMVVKKDVGEPHAPFAPARDALILFQELVTEFRREGDLQSLLALDRGLGQDYGPEIAKALLDFSGRGIRSWRVSHLAVALRQRGVDLYRVWDRALWYTAPPSTRFTGFVPLIDFLPSDLQDPDVFMRRLKEATLR